MHFVFKAVSNIFLGQELRRKVTFLSIMETTFTHQLNCAIGAIVTHSKIKKIKKK